MSNPYTKAKQGANCRGRYCLRDAVALSSTTIERRQQSAKRRSLTISIASEEPVERWCEQRMTVVKEVLLLDGMELREQQTRVPLIDGNRSTIRNVIGSVGSIRKQNGLLVGEISWARCKRSKDVEAKWQDGHIETFEVESQAMEVEEYHSGMTWRNIKGPVDVVTRWQPIVAVVRAARGG